MVFDRGLVSDENLGLIEDKNLKYITALDRDQIPNIPNIDLQVFKDLNSGNALEHIPRLPGFSQFDASLYYHDLGVRRKRRYVVGINPERFIQDRKTRKEKMECFRRFLVQTNRSLKKSKKDRKPKPTINKSLPFFSPTLTTMLFFWALLSSSPFQQHPSSSIHCSIHLMRSFL